jgi:MFS family permease
LSQHPPSPSSHTTAPAGFTRYQKTVVGLLAFLQFAVILDFMLMSPLGAVIMPAMQITPQQFGLVVSAYAFSAGASGLLTAGFADRFDRKRLLLFFYGGFVLGTVWCGLAQSFESLLVARIVTGLFGGVIGSITLAIATDLFAPHLRGRVMGSSRPPLPPARCWAFRSGSTSPTPGTGMSPSWPWLRWARWVVWWSASRCNRWMATSSSSRNTPHGCTFITPSRNRVT